MRMKSGGWRRGEYSLFSRRYRFPRSAATRSDVTQELLRSTIAGEVLGGCDGRTNKRVTSVTYRCWMVWMDRRCPPKREPNMVENLAKTSERGRPFLHVAWVLLSLKSWRHLLLFRPSGRE